MQTNDQQTNDRQTNDRASSPQSGHRFRRWLACTFSALLLLATGCQATAEIGGDEIITRSNDGLEVRPQSDFVEEETEETEETGGEAEQSGGVEVAQCTVEVSEGGTFASVLVTNASTDPVDVFMRVSVTDVGGNELTTERLAVTSLRAGSSSLERTQTWSPAGERIEGAVACDVLESRTEPASDLLRSAGDDLPDGAFACRVVGVDLVGDVALEVDISNPFDELRSMQAMLALLDEDGIRVGAALPTLPEVSPGDSDGLQVSTSVPGFVEATSCEVIWAISRN